MAFVRMTGTAGASVTTGNAIIKRTGDSSRYKTFTAPKKGTYTFMNAMSNANPNGTTISAKTDNDTLFTDSITSYADYQVAIHENVSLNEGDLVTFEFGGGAVNIQCASFYVCN